MSVATPTEKTIFLEALEIAASADRTAFLDRTCSHDPQLRSAVEALLLADERSQSLLDATAASVFERPGTQIGPYKLLQQIGEGGMGVVYMAEQTEPIARRVALKIIKPGMNTRQVIARFEAERQALSLMDHPNIAKVLDAGTTSGGVGQELGVGIESLITPPPDTRLLTPGSGRPYFVMELVKGQPITQYCDEHHLNPRQRLELLLPVCQAIQHAHQKGIIHRDIKPTNILVTLYDGAPVPKVIDFGVAKATAQKLTDKTMFTEYGQLVGTLEYMSPEQAQLNQLDIDTRSDIYSLGVLLYELLTGSTPFDRSRLCTVAFDETLRIIREEEPPKPSTKLSASDTLPAIAANRNVEPARLRKLVRGELDWIVMKCLEKDRNRRFESASALAADMQRYLHDEPVQACPPSLGYRVRKFVRRNIRALATVLLLGVMLFVAAGALVGSAQSRAKVEADSTKKLQHNLYLTHIALAEREQAVANWGRAEELLDLCPEHLRGFEWYYLKRLRHTPPLTISLDQRQIGGTGFGLDFSPDGRHLAAPCGGDIVKVWDLATDEFQVLRGHTQRVLRVAYSSDGRLLASAGEDMTVKLWDLTAGGREVSNPRFTLEGHKAPVGGLAFSPNGRYLASAGHDRQIILWDTTTGNVFRQFPGEFLRYQYLNVAFSPPDGRWIAAGSANNTVKIWEVESGEEVSLDGHTEPVFSVFFSSDGKRLASLGFDDHAVRVWEMPASGLAESPPEPLVLAPGHSRGAWSVAFSPNGKVLAVAGGVADGNVRLYDATTGKILYTLEGHIERVISVAFSPDGKRLASTSLDRTVKLWETATGQEVLTLHGHTDSVSRVLFSPDGERLASVSVDGTLKVWDARRIGGGTPRHTRTLKHDGIVYDVAFRHDGRLASASADNTVRQWDPQTGKNLFSLRGDADKFLCVTFSPDGRQIAAGSVDRSVRLWDATTGRELRTITDFKGPVRSLAFGPNGRLATCGGLTVVQVWDTTTEGEALLLSGHRDFVYDVAFQRNGNHIATASADMTVKVWNAADGKEICTLAGHAGRVTSVAFSPDGRLLAAGDTNKSVKIWDWANKQVIHTYTEHTNHVFGMDFSPDGRYLASTSWAEVIIFDLHDTEEKIRPEGGHAGTIWGVAFSPDGQYLAAASGYKGKGEIKVWDTVLWKDKANSEH